MAQNTHLGDLYKMAIVSVEENSAYKAGSSVNIDLPNLGNFHVRKFTIDHNVGVFTGHGSGAIGVLKTNSIIERIKLRVGPDVWFDTDDERDGSDEPWVLRCIRKMPLVKTSSANVEIKDERWVINLYKTLPKNKKIRLTIYYSNLATIGANDSTDYSGTLDVKLSNSQPTGVGKYVISTQKWHLGTANGRQKEMLDETKGKVIGMWVIAEDNGTEADDIITDFKISDGGQKVEIESNWIDLKEDADERYGNDLGVGFLYFMLNSKIAFNSIMWTCTLKSGSTDVNVRIVYLMESV